MRSRQAIGYVVQIDGVDITLNLMDVHRGSWLLTCMASRSSLKSAAF